MTDVDLAFFDITHYLFTPEFVAGASVLLGQNDEDR